jgi:hypothetical protein
MPTPSVDRVPCGWSSRRMTDAELRDQLIVSAIQGAAVHEGAIPDDVARRAVDVADAVMTRLREKRTDPPQGAKPLG